MKKIDRVILAVIAVALTVIALNPWVAPGYVSAQGQGGVVQVDIVGVGGRAVSKTTYIAGTLPVEIKGSVNIIK